MFWLAIVLDWLFCAAFVAGIVWLARVQARVQRCELRQDAIEAACPHACPTVLRDGAPHTPRRLGPQHLTPWEGESNAH